MLATALTAKNLQAKLFETGGSIEEWDAVEELAQRVLVGSGLGICGQLSRQSLLKFLGTSFQLTRFEDISVVR